MTGLIDWDFIEDRHREIQQPNEFQDLKQLVDVALLSYRLPRWADQSNYVELWLEKSALAGVLSSITKEYHLSLVIDKGYASVTFMYEASERFKAASQNDKNCFLLYLGDHDPSGEDMVRDVRKRLQDFGLGGEEVEVRKVGLTIEQVREFDLPPNPAKMTDPRAESYVERHGDQSWELDALPPNVLDHIVTDAVLELIDLTKYNKVIEQEETDKQRLSQIMRELGA